MATIAQIYIDGEILPESYIWPEDQATSLYRVRQQVAAAGTFDRIKLNIFSPGGYCLEGWAIVDYLLSLGVPIDTLAYGQCASFGTVFHTMGEVREISSHCNYVVHRPWDMFIGNDLGADEFKAYLTGETNKLFSHYSPPTGKTIEELGALIGKEDLELSPQETVVQGFSTTIYTPATASARASIQGVKLSKPTYLLSLKDRRVNPNAPKDSKSIQTTMAEKKNTLIEAAKSFLAFVGGTDTKALDVTLKDGRKLVTNSTGDDPVVGDTAQLDGADAPDGDYVTAKDVVLTVASGVITAVSEGDDTSADASASTDTPETIAAMKKELGETKATLATTQTRMSQMETRMTAILGGMVSQDVTTQANRVKSPAVQANAPVDEQEVARDEMLEKHVNKFKRPQAAAK